MTVEDIERKHGLLVNGYEGMLPEARIKYHTRTTLMAIVDELQEMLVGIKGLSISATMPELLKKRVAELQELIDKQ